MFGLSHTPPKKIPAARYRGSQSVPNATFRQHIFQTKVWEDPGYQLDSTQVFLTISTPGRYKIVAFANCGTNVGVFQWQIRINGVARRSWTLVPHRQGGYYWAVSYTVFLNLNAGDIIDNILLQFGGTQTINYAFTILKIG